MSTTSTLTAANASLYPSSAEGTGKKRGRTVRSWLIRALLSPSWSSDLCPTSPHRHRSKSHQVLSHSLGRCRGWWNENVEVPMEKTKQWGWSPQWRRCCRGQNRENTLHPHTKRDRTCQGSRAEQTAMLKQGPGAPCCCSWICCWALLSTKYGAKSTARRLRADRCLSSSNGSSVGLSFTGPREGARTHGAEGWGLTEVEGQGRVWGTHWRMR